MPVTLPERVVGDIAPRNNITCDVGRWIEAATDAAAENVQRIQRIEDAWGDGQTDEYFDALGDKAAIRQLVALVGGKKSKLCAECPQAECPTEEFMRDLQAAPLQSGAQIVLDGFFK